MLLLSCLLFLIGFAVIFFKKNVIAQLMGIELMLNAANINFIAFNQNSANTAIPLLIIAFAVAESAVGLAIIYRIYRAFGSIDSDKASEIGED